MPTWRFYDLASGVMLSTRLRCERSQVAANTPAGHAAIAGDYDPLTQRVDVSVPRPVDAGDDWQPPVVPWQPPPRALEDVKRDARQRMARAYEEARAAGVTLGGKTAPTHADAWTRYLVIRQMADELVGWQDVPIPLADGTFELLTLAKAQALWAALKDMERTLLMRLRDRVQAINTAATAADVDAVVW